MFDNSHTLRASVLSGTSLFVVVVMLLFAIYNAYYNEAYFLSFIDLLAATYASYTYRLAQKHKHKEIHIQAFVYLMLLAAILGVYMLPFEHGTFLWTVGFPVILYALLGLKQGQITSGGFLVVQIFSIYITTFDRQSEYITQNLINLTACYIAIWIVAHLYEYNRSNIENSLTYLASRDSLTGAHNRLSLTSAFDYFENNRDHNCSLCMLFIDLDYFKQVNDQYGHDAGDKVLIETATILGQVVGDDNLYRIGGEEFCVTIFDQDISQAEVVAERVRALVCNHLFKFGDKCIAITLSVGICEYSEGDKLNDLLKLADQQLYQAKKNGRNQVHFKRVPGPYTDETPVESSI